MVARVPRQIPDNGRIPHSHVAIFVSFCREVAMANANLASMSVEALLKLREDLGERPDPQGTGVEGSACEVRARS